MAEELTQEEFNAKSDVVVEELIKTMDKTYKKLLEEMTNRIISFHREIHIDDKEKSECEADFVQSFLQIVELKYAESKGADISVVEYVPEDDDQDPHVHEPSKEESSNHGTGLYL